MNALGWELDHSKKFQAATEAYCSRLDAQFIAGPSDPEVERLTEELEQLADFVRAAHRLLEGEIDPISLPRLCGADGAPISNYYVLAVGPWHGYYLLDQFAKAGHGTIACNEKIHNLEVCIRDAVDEARKGPEP